MSFIYLFHDIDINAYFDLIAVLMEGVDTLPHLFLTYLLPSLPGTYRHVQVKTVLGYVEGREMNDQSRLVNWK